MSRHQPVNLFSKLLILAALVTLSGTRSVIAQARESTAPYLYYFDSERSAFVVERADGTDSRILGQNLMSSDVDTVDGAGWSPSGKWFAWTATHTYQLPDSAVTGGLGFDPFVIRVFRTLRETPYIR
jgi:hypothetical protein